MLQFKNFDLEEMENSDYKFVIYSTSFETPFAYLDEIMVELKKCDYNHFKVLFDLLLSRGNTSERFVEAIFNGETFDNLSFRYIKLGKKNHLREQTGEFYSTHLFLLENSVLNSAQKKLLEKGIYI